LPEIASLFIQKPHLRNAKRGVFVFKPCTTGKPLRAAATSSPQQRNKSATTRLVRPNLDLLLGSRRSCCLRRAVAHHIQIGLHFHLIRYFVEGTLCVIPKSRRLNAIPPSIIWAPLDDRMHRNHHRYWPGDFAHRQLPFHHEFRSIGAWYHLRGHKFNFWKFLHFEGMLAFDFFVLDPATPCHALRLQFQTQCRRSIVNPTIPQSRKHPLGARLGSDCLEILRELCRRRSKGAGFDVDVSSIVPCMLHQNLVLHEKKSRHPKSHQHHQPSHVRRIHFLRVIRSAVSANQTPNHH
jgi:hypothetical protein